MIVGYGEKGAGGDTANGEGGPGGYAGIHVPFGANLNLNGKGTIISFGGSASDGAKAIGYYGGRWRWRGWSRNRRKWSELVVRVEDFLNIVIGGKALFLIWVQVLMVQMEKIVVILISQM